MGGVLGRIMSVGGRAEEDLATLGGRRGKTRVGERVDGNVQTELAAGGKGKVRGIGGTMVATAWVESRVQ
jgi:hypothetical protein